MNTGEITTTGGLKKPETVKRDFSNEAAGPTKLIITDESREGILTTTIKPRRLETMLELALRK